MNCFGLPGEKKSAPGTGSVLLSYQSLLFGIQACKKFIIAALIDFPQFNKHAGPDVQLTGFVFCIRSSANIAAASL